MYRLISDTGEAGASSADDDTQLASESAVEPGLAQAPKSPESSSEIVMEPPKLRLEADEAE